MSDRTTSSVFLERLGYRRRRMADAARLLPIFGAVLWVMPLLVWGNADQSVGPARVLLYIFGVWFLLIGIAAIIAPQLRITEDGNEARDPDKTARPRSVKDGPA
jgi:hypothetical protein